MIPTTKLFTKTWNRRRHFMQPRSNPNFMHGDFEKFSRVWRSIESLFLTLGLRKDYAREVGIRSVPQYQISPNFLFWGLFRGGRTRKSAITLKYATGRGKDIATSIPWWTRTNLKWQSNVCVRLWKWRTINSIMRVLGHFIWVDCLNNTAYAKLSWVEFVV